MTSTLALLLQNEGSNPFAALFGGMATLFWLALVVVVIIGGWKMFEKAGQPGWAILVPIYNAYILLKIAGRPGW
jgi:fructose-specific phosphotransferase system IIC component